LAELAAHGQDEGEDAGPAQRRGVPESAARGAIRFDDRPKRAEEFGRRPDPGEDARRVAHAFARLATRDGGPVDDLVSRGKMIVAFRSAKGRPFRGAK